MPAITVNPTRIELSRLKKKLTTAIRGHKLLKDKHDELTRQLTELQKNTGNLRKKVEKEIELSKKHMAIAQSTMTKEAVSASLMTNNQSLLIQIEEKNIMSVKIPKYTFSKLSSEEENIFPYGFFFTSSDIDIALITLKKILPDLIKMSEAEKACMMMSAEIEKTRRRVNALEHILIPKYKETIRYIRLRLEENERSTITRLLKIKDMILEGNN